MILWTGFLVAPLERSRESTEPWKRYRTKTTQTRQ